MSGVWIFRNGVARLVSNPLLQSLDEAGMELGEHKRRKVLVYLPTNEVIQSYADLEPKLMALGWERYPDEDPDMLQYHKSSSSIHLISLPLDFRRFKTMHMYDIVVKNRAVFEVRDEIM